MSMMTYLLPSRPNALDMKGVLALLTFGVATWTAHADIGPMPTTLKGVPVPEVPGLLDGEAPIVVSRERAIALGKALFWDVNVGSDGMACASCHFHAGADRRVRNQLAAGGKGVLAAAFDVGSEGLQRGPNLMLRLADFPLTESKQPLTEAEVAGLARWSDDVVGSAGSFGGRFRAVDYGGAGHDDCVRAADPVHQLSGIGTRRVIERNAPTVINAVFNHRLLWDGRANNVFNGSNALGPRDPDAGVWVLQADGSVKRERLALPNSALASQALTAPMNEREMSCGGRAMADIGRKLLYRNPLERQLVHSQDSVLGPWARSARSPGQPGLTLDYISLVQQAFHPRFWSDKRRGPFGKPATGARGVMSLAYSQIEANFGLFFGLALQMYQSTLVADDSPFDRSARDDRHLPTDLTPAELRGLQVFRRAHCALCHIGPHFSSAAVSVNARLVPSRPWAFGDSQFRNTTSANVVTRMAGHKGFGFIDTGFAATGVGRDEWDPGLAGRDERGQDLAWAAQYLKLLAGDRAAVSDPAVLEVRACDLATPIALNQARANAHYFTQADGIQPQPQPTVGCLSPARAFVPTPVAAATELARPLNRRLLLLADAAFKIPTLRNVELTGPYMHNGSMATLDQVIEFYARGGNFPGASVQFGTVFPQPELQLDAGARADLKAFLRSLTDDRVRYERAPFDHPELRVPHGHTGDRTRVQPGSFAAGLAQDDELVLPAVGAGGRATPLMPFEAYLAP